MVSTSQTLQSTTQKYLEIFDIGSDLIILQDGTCSLILRTSAINFDLFSEEEQDATIYSYAALLNSLSFPIEIVIRSQKKDLSSYLDLLKSQETKSYTPLRKQQIKEYRSFIEQMLQERNVLDKKFYLVITASAVEMGLLSATTLLPGAKKDTPITFDKYAVIEKALTILQPRRDHLMHQLARIGLSSTQLKTQELIRLFYGIYNQESAEGLKIQNTNDYTTPLVLANLRTPTPSVVPAPPTPSSDSLPPPTPPQTSVVKDKPPETPAVTAENVLPNTGLKEDSFSLVQSDLKPPTPPAV